MLERLIVLLKVGEYMGNVFLYLIGWKKIPELRNLVLVSKISRFKTSSCG